MAENKGYMTLSDEQGSIHISEEVIAAIAVGDRKSTRLNSSHL